MRKLVIATIGVIAFVLLGIAGGAIAQEKKMEKAVSKVTTKVLAENAKTRAYEVTFGAGAENTAIPASSVRVVRVLKGGKLERTYADGKKENLVYKAGEVRLMEPGPAYGTKNVGSSEVKLYVVLIK